MAYLEDRESYASYENIKRELKKLNKHLRDKYLDEIDQKLLLAIKESRRSEYDKRYSEKQKQVSAKTVNHTLSQIRSVLHFSNKIWKWTDSLPEIPFMSMNNFQEQQHRVLSKEESKKLIDELPVHLKPIVKLALLTGLREANLTGLKWKNIDIDQSRIQIDGKDFKNRKNFSVPITQEALSIIKEQYGKHTDYIFTYKGKRIKKANSYAWRKALDRAGIAPYIPCSYYKPKDISLNYPSRDINDYKFTNFRFHDLRHTWASWHVNSGTSLAQLQRLGGWSNYETVLRYAHLDDDPLRESAKKVSLSF